MTPDILGPCTIYNADNQTLPPITADALISDPPYGSKTDTDYTRFSGGLSTSRNFHKRESGGFGESKEWAGIVGDNVPFDPRPWLPYKKVCLWGYQYFAQHLPLGSTFVWIKKRDTQLGTFLSDAELAWVKGGHGVYCFRHVWHGFDRQSEKGKTKHPTEKPPSLFGFCFDRMKLQPGQTVYDPYMGSGPCAIECIRRGLRYVGCEIEPAYYDVARQRIIAELATLN